VSCLVRNSDKGAKVASQYAKVRLVYGTLDDVDVLEKEAAEADIVLSISQYFHQNHQLIVTSIDFADADGEGAAKAFVKGLAAHPEGRPGYFIHTSGTGILLFKDMETKNIGEASSKIYDDWDGIEEVTTLPDSAPHRNVDKVVIAGGLDHAKTTKTAIVAPPAIYGKGRGPDNQRSMQLPDLAKWTLRNKNGFQVGAGKAYWNSIHVADLSKLYLKLVEAAAAGGGNATWNDQGYYFAEQGEHQWGDISKLVASAADKQGFIHSDEVVSLSAVEVGKLHPWGAMLWGANSRCKAIRAKKLFGWSPTERTIQDEVPDAVHAEAVALELTGGHAMKVAG
jgi:nucleoside-diphosphate-sugar epimerase